MLSARVEKKDFEELRRALRQEEQARSAYEALGELLKAMKKLALECEESAALEEPPEGLYQPMQDFLEAARPLLSEGLSAHQLLYDRYFEALDYLRVADQFHKDYRALVEPEGKNLSVKLWCYDPARALRESMGRVRASILFSATLSPIDYYMRLTGLSEEEGDASMELDSPFPRENLLALRYPVDTRFSARERTAPMVARALKMMCEARPGNYLACLPSYAYLNLTLDHFLALGAKAEVLVQRGGMSDAQRGAFLERFTESPAKSMVAFVVMGGVFAEGIDLPGEKLIGAAIVGVGIPQPSFEIEVLRSLTDDGEGSGFQNAYVYPGIERVLQAAGRVIRTETDRGVVLLVDERYQVPEYRRLLPRFWRVRPAGDEKKLKELLRAFWDGDSEDQ
jgi:Rad3-related DNA helicase